MRILFLATNPSIEASTRYRVMQYFPALRAAGHDPELSTFFPERRAGGAASRLVRGAATRARDLLRAADYDVIVVHRELLPFAWNDLASVLAARAPVVYDLDDAVFMRGAQTGWRAHLTRPESSASLARAASRVLAGNEYLGAWARQHSRAVEVLPTVVDTDQYRPAERPPRDVPVVGWIGSPTTAQYLDQILDILDDLAREHRFVLRVVGAGRPIRLRNVEVESPPWTAATEVELFRDLDIGVYPLVDDPWARGKCGFKAIQYMACGTAAVVNPVGVVETIMRDGVDGLWARSAEEWRGALDQLLRDPDLRVRLGAEARRRAVEQYSLRAVAPQLVRALESASRRSGV